jgi:hypothetical protein
MLLCALLLGVLAGLLTWADGGSAFAAARDGGATFGGTVVVLLGILYFVTHGDPKP